MLFLKLFLILLSLIFLLVFLIMFFVFFLLLQLIGHIFHCDFFLIFILLLILFVPSLLLLLLTFLLIPVVPPFLYSFYHFSCLSAFPLLFILVVRLFFISSPLFLSYSAPLTTDTVHVVLSPLATNYHPRSYAGTCSGDTVIESRQAQLQCVQPNTETLLCNSFGQLTPPLAPKHFIFLSLISSVIKCVMHHIV